MRLAIAVPEEHVDPRTLNAGLEVNTRVNESMLATGEYPTFREAVSAGKVQWKPEPPGEERFDHLGIVLGRGWGDCDDLAPYHVASLRATGEDPDARAFVRRSGPNTWHALVERGDGTIQDPSKAAGMHGATGVVVGGVERWPQDLGARAPILPSMFPPHNLVGGGQARPCVAARVVGRGQWEARADTPWNNTAYGLSSLARSPVASTALVGAILGSVSAANCSGSADPQHLDAMMALAGLLDGHDPDDVADCYGEEETEHARVIVKGLQRAGISFGKIFHAFEPLTAKLISFIPGVGPIAASALDITNKLIPTDSVPPPQPPTGASTMPPKARSAAAAAAATQAPIPPPPGQALPAHYAAMETYPGGPFVMRF